MPPVPAPSLSRRAKLNRPSSRRPAPAPSRSSQLTEPMAGVPPEGTIEIVIPFAPTDPAIVDAAVARVGPTLGSHVLGISITFNGGTGRTTRTYRLRSSATPSTTPAIPPTPAERRLRRSESPPPAPQPRRLSRHRLLNLLRRQPGKNPLLLKSHLPGRRRLLRHPLRRASAQSRQRHPDTTEPSR